MEENNQHQAPVSGRGKSSLVWVILIIVVAVGVYFLTRGEKPAGNTENTQLTDMEQEEVEQLEEDPSVLDNPSLVASEVKTFNVDGENFKFSLSEIKVKKGDTVKIVFNNKAGFHDWVIDEFSARTKQIKAGESETIEFVADKTGTFEYYCSVGQHRANGMKGSLIVE